MAELQLHHLWLRRSIFFVLCVLVLLSHLIPLETVPPSLGGVSVELAERPAPGLAQPPGPDQQVSAEDPVRWIAPDLLILLTLAWVTRRPTFVPALFVVVLFLAADFLLQKPPGLWTCLVLMLSEFLRSRSRNLRTLPFWIEWATVSFGLAAITLLDRVILSAVLIPQASLGLTLLQLALTIATYPLVVFVSYAFFGISRPAPGEVDAAGRRQ